MTQSKVSLSVPAYLEHYPEPGAPAHRIVLDPLPFRLGRSATANYTIYSPQVSKEHTEIFRAGKEFRIRDLGSTNGTFVNGVRVKESPLVSGDIIHVATKELRFGCEPAEATDDYGNLNTQPAESQAPTSLIRGSAHLREMLTQHHARALFQPIVHLDTGELMGFEALGRGAHSELSVSPLELFRLAGQCNLACELSRLFRMVALNEVGRLPENAALFFNLHPSEMGNSFLIDSLRQLKDRLRPGQRIVLEVHEGMVADLKTMHWLRDQVKELGFGLAYDDFGAGQSRLAELAEVPPDYLKFDMSLIRGIDTAEGRREVVQALNRVSHELGVQTLAEGIEREEEARVCRELGCHYGQGYLFGRPQPSETHTGRVVRPPMPR